VVRRLGISVRRPESPRPDLYAWIVGLLAVDVTTHGVVMSADSQPVEIRDGVNHIDMSAAHRTRNPIIVRVGGGFVGLVGYAGTEHVDGMDTARWLRRFDREWPDDDLGTFCHRLAQSLTEVWRRDGMRSVLEILVTGETGGELQFWFVRNSQGLRPDGRHEAPAEVFDAQDDLDAYLRADGRPGEGKDALLARRTYSFRQGVLLPASPVFDGFSNLMEVLISGGVPGFEPLASLDDVGQFARVRMEFLKRLCGSGYGIYREGTPTPISGNVHVFGVGRDGGVSEYVKQRSQVKTVRKGRP
jgi:hypothetical protein